MKLPNADRAIVDEEKIVGYLLNRQHPDGAGKAKFYESLGFDVSLWQVLADALKDLVKHSPVRCHVDSVHGSKYIIEGPLHTPSGRTEVVRSVWIIDHGKTVPRLVTAYPI
jgi:hypothetical protein